MDATVMQMVSSHGSFEFIEEKKEDNAVTLITLLQQKDAEQEAFKENSDQ